MSQYRITELIHNSGFSDRSREFIIERKRPIIGWKEVKAVEVDSKRISHKTYEEAEQYLLSNYTGHGICKRKGNIYQFSHYVYFV